MIGSLGVGGRVIETGSWVGIVSHCNPNFLDPSSSSKTENYCWGINLSLFTSAELIFNLALPWTLELALGGKMS